MTQTITKQQQVIIDRVKQYCPDAKVPNDEGYESKYIFITWTNNEDHFMLKEDYMARIGPRGAFKILSASRFGADDKHKKTLAELCLYRVGIRGTIGLV